MSIYGDKSEDFRYEGIFVVYNMVTADGEAGKLTNEKLLAAGPVQILTECAKKRRRAELVEVTVQALKLILEGK